MPIPDGITMLLPWKVLDASHAKQLEIQLSNDLSPSHVLQSRKVRALAGRFDRDDVLFEVESDTPILALVHITWHQETNPRLPNTQLFIGWDQWVQDILLPSRTEYTLGE